MYRNANPKKLIIRTDNGPQFKSKATEASMNEMEITHQFGYKNNPDSQVFIESYHSALEREFVRLNSFERIEDIFYAYNAYIFFYHILRPNGSLDYLIPSEYNKMFCFMRIIQVVVLIQNLFLQKNEISLYLSFYNIVGGRTSIFINSHSHNKEIEIFLIVQHHKGSIVLFLY